MTTLSFSQGIDAQPAALAQSRVSVLASLRHLPDTSIGTVALVGIGASAMAALSAALAWRDAGLRTFAVSAPELSAGGPGAADVVVAISLSGRSAETVAAVKGLKGIPTIGVTMTRLRHLPKPFRWWSTLVAGRTAALPRWGTPRRCKRSG